MPTSSGPIPSSPGETTWYGFARAILDQAGYADLEIEPVPTSAFETAAPRPAYSVLDNGVLRDANFKMMPDWRDALQEYIRDRKTEFFKILYIIMSKKII